MEPTRFLELSHSTLPYWKRGQGPDLLFFHGWPFHSQTWHSVVENLEDSFTCHLFDLPGAGLSRISAQTSLTLSAHVQTVQEAIELMDIESGKFGVIGHDSGGSIARLVAASMPERITGMVFGNTEVPHHYSKLFRYLLQFGHLPGASTIFRLMLRSKRAVSQMALVGRSRRKLHNQLAKTYFERLVKNDLAMSFAWSLVNNIHVHDFDQLAAAHAKITTPVHLVWGKRDPWFPLKDAQTMLDTFGGKAELTVIDDGALMVHEEVPEEFAAIVKKNFVA